MKIINMQVSNFFILPQLTIQNFFRLNSPNNPRHKTEPFNLDNILMKLSTLKLKIPKISKVLLNFIKKYSTSWSTKTKKSQTENFTNKTSSKYKNK